MVSSTLHNSDNCIRCSWRKQNVIVMCCVYLGSDQALISTGPCANQNPWFLVHWLSLVPAAGAAPRRAREAPSMIWRIPEVCLGTSWTFRYLLDL